MSQDILGGKQWDVLTGDCLALLATLPDNSVDSCVTSPPYFGLRDYGHADQIGLEETPAAYVEKMVCVFAEVRRILKPSGVMWLNIGDSYANKALQMIPARLAIALQEDGWLLRDEVIWHKPNPMPESATDRCTRAYEKVFMLTKSEQYFFDADAISEPATHAGQIKSFGNKNAAARLVKQLPGNMKPGAVYETKPFRNRRNVWTIQPEQCKEAHFAVMPQELARLCIVSATPAGGVVLDPFTGAGTTGLVAGREGRQFIGCELNPDYATIACRRIQEAYRQPRLDFDAPEQSPKPKYETGELEL